MECVIFLFVGWGSCCPFPGYCPDDVCVLPLSAVQVARSSHPITAVLPRSLVLAFVVGALCCSEHHVAVAEGYVNRRLISVPRRAWVKNERITFDSCEMSSVSTRMLRSRAQQIAFKGWQFPVRVAKGGEKKTNKRTEKIEVRARMMCAALGVPTASHISSGKIVRKFHKCKRKSEWLAHRCCSWLFHYGFCARVEQEHASAIEKLS